MSMRELPYKIVYWQEEKGVYSWCDGTNADKVDIQFHSLPHYLTWEFQLPKEKWQFDKFLVMIQKVIEFGKKQRSNEIGAMMKGLIDL
jgi:hypothetical protein